MHVRKRNSILDIDANRGRRGDVTLIDVAGHFLTVDVNRRHMLGVRVVTGPHLMDYDADRVLLLDLVEDLGSFAGRSPKPWQALRYLASMDVPAGFDHAALREFHMKQQQAIALLPFGTHTGPSPVFEHVSARLYPEYTGECVDRPTERRTRHRSGRRMTSPPPEPWTIPRPDQLRDTFDATTRWLLDGEHGAAVIGPTVKTMPSIHARTLLESILTLDGAHPGPIAQRPGLRIMRAMPSSEQLGV